ncbi:MAG: aminotransferase class I/II-fold pyridoxal phosphate-dependent enzyme [Planctomycetota bacterium]
MFARRVRNLRPSGIREIFRLVAQMENPVNLSIGQAHFDVPDNVKEAACEAIQSGRNKYTVTGGLPELNDKIRASIMRRSGRCPEASLVTAGTSGALMLSYLSLLNPGDEILLPDPYFIIYRSLAEILEVRPVYYDLYPDFRLTEAKLEAQVSPRARVILINTPANPTGATLSESELRAVARVAKRHDLLVIADEIYDAFVYDGRFRSIVEFCDKVLLLGGFSKTYGMPGWRLGYAVGPGALIDIMATLQQFSFVCASAPAQYAALVALETDMSPWIAEYRLKRQRIVEGLKGYYQAVTPGGSFYIFPRLPDGISGQDFVKRALDRKLLIVPGTAFSRRDSHFRISFAAEDDDIDRGLAILRDLAQPAEKRPNEECGDQESRDRESRGQERLGERAQIGG